MKETNDYGMYSGGYIFDQMDRAALAYVGVEGGVFGKTIVTQAVDGLRFRRQLCDKYNVTVRCYDFHKIELFSTLYTCKAEVINNKGNGRQSLLSKETRRPNNRLGRRLDNRHIKSHDLGKTRGL